MVKEYELKPNDAKSYILLLTYKNLFIQRLTLAVARSQMRPTVAPRD